MNNQTLNIEKSITQISLSNEEREVIDLALSILNDKFKRNPEFCFTSPKLVSEYIQLNVASLEREVFGVLYLDNQHRLISDEIEFYGTIDAASVYPREVAKKALYKNCAAVVLYHNHPSGVAEPSQSDRTVTRRISEALELIGVRVLDHFVVSIDDSVSFSERGWI